MRTPVTWAALVVIRLAIGAASAPRLLAQTPASDLSFEVASIKPNTSSTGGFSMTVQPGGRLVVSNMTTEHLVETAYNVQNFQLVGMPAWSNTDRFDITAKSTTDPSNAAVAAQRTGDVSPLQMMLRSLLRDRFKLAAHTEMRSAPVYALVRLDRRVGPNLKPSAKDCWADAHPDVTCSIGGTAGRFRAASATLAQVARGLEPRVNRPVVDRTGMTGLYDVDLTWAPLVQPSDANEPHVDPDGPSIFTAVQEQLGLKLEATTGPVNVLVIDRIEHPSEN